MYTICIMGIDANDPAISKAHIYSETTSLAWANATYMFTKYDNAGLYMGKI